MAQTQRRPQEINEEIKQMEKAVNSDERVTKGGCACGAVQFEAYGDPTKTIYCHCTACRRQTGSPAVVFVVLDRDKVQFARGARKCYESSPSVMRLVCVFNPPLEGTEIHDPDGSYS